MGLEHAGRNPNASGSRRIARPVGGGRYAESAAEARRERSNAAQSDGEADVRDCTVGVAEQRGSPLEPAGEEVLVRRLAEGPPELAAEVRRREPRSARERRHVELLSVAGVDQVLRAEEMARRRDWRDHLSSIAGAVKPVRECLASTAPPATAEGRPFLCATAQELAFLEAAPGAEHDALERRVRDDDGQPGFRAQKQVEPP
jgi:hypothetical protein